MMYAYRKAFFVGHGSFWLNMDLIVVTVALVIEVRNTPFLKLKAMIILPRQARDKRRKG